MSASCTKKRILFAVTYARILLIPAFILAFYLEYPYNYYTPAGVFFIAALTDFLDGLLARKWELTSDYGAMLDQIADKLIVTTALVILVGLNIAGMLPVIIILLREIWVSGLREYVGGQGKKLPVQKTGKLKTTVQMVAIIALLMGAPGLRLASDGLAVLNIGHVLLWIAAALAAWSACGYTLSARKAGLL